MQQQRLQVCPEVDFLLPLDRRRRCPSRLSLELAVIVTTMYTAFSTHSPRAPPPDMFERTLQDLIRGLRAHKASSKAQEDAFLQEAMVEIREELKGKDMNLKAEGVLKMCYVGSAPSISSVDELI